MINITEEPATYWSFEIDGEEYDADFNTLTEASTAMDEYYAERVRAEESPQNNQTFTLPAKIFNYYYNDENEKIITSTKSTAATYTHERSEREEHGTY
jgi:predicted neuraminidase